MYYSFDNSRVEFDLGEVKVGLLNVSMVIHLRYSVYALSYWLVRLGCKWLLCMLLLLII